MSLTWQPTKSLVARDWQDEEAFYQWAEMTQPLRTSQGFTWGILIGMAFWIVIGIGVFIGRRMGL